MSHARATPPTADNPWVGFEPVWDGKCYGPEDAYSGIKYGHDIPDKCPGLKPSIVLSDLLAVYQNPSLAQPPSVIKHRAENSDLEFMRGKRSPYAMLIEWMDWGDWSETILGRETWLQIRGMREAIQQARPRLRNRLIAQAVEMCRAAEGGG